MPFELFTDVILTEDLPAENLRAGDVGTVVDRHPDPSGPRMEGGYSIEFFDMVGDTVCVLTVPANLLRLPSHADPPAGPPIPPWSHNTD